jgi:hypothetical protein
MILPNQNYTTSFCLLDLVKNHCLLQIILFLIFNIPPTNPNTPCHHPRNYVTVRTRDIYSTPLRVQILLTSPNTPCHHPQKNAQKPPHSPGTKSSPLLQGKSRRYLERQDDQKFFSQIGSWTFLVLLGSAR